MLLRGGESVGFMISINDKSLQSSYFRITNYHQDYGITGESYHIKLKSRKEFRKVVALYKKRNDMGMRLVATDNGLGYTRLVYRLTNNLGRL